MPSLLRQDNENGSTSPVKPTKLKGVDKVSAAIFDYGNFQAVAEKLAQSFEKMYYFSPFETEYQDIREYLIGRGMENVERVYDYLDPKFIEKVDLFIFPDIGFTSLQKYLRSIGKAVWGQMGGQELEMDRVSFYDAVKKAGLPVAPYEVVEGIDELRAYLQDHDNKWIKINRFRHNMETWHHLDYDHSERMLDSLSVTFGGAKNVPLFVVQDEIDTDMEGGYDGWCIDGSFPSTSFQGYEKKNELYLGSLLKDEELPSPVREVNEKMSPLLKKFGYRDWWATEVRISDGKPFFIDPTPRMPGQTGEHQIENLLNMAEVIWYGAHGIPIEPKWGWKFAAEATLHYDALSHDDAVGKEWKTLEIPPEVEQWVKLAHYAKIDGIYQFVPAHNDEVGVVIGVGNSVQESLDNLKENLDALEDTPVHANVHGFVDLLRS
ncbi:MAG: hypothetical protein KGJ13_08660, partial [Patescibacteria group bacterium]|nr:hypothetical protein [Patescibacteria group bacterium]